MTAVRRTAVAAGTGSALFDAHAAPTTRALRPEAQASRSGDAGAGARRKPGKRGIEQAVL